MNPVTRIGPSCSHIEGCHKPISTQGLCVNHFRRWKAFGGEYPGSDAQHYKIVRDGTDGLFDVTDNYTGLPAHLGKKRCHLMLVDDALDAMAELRLEDLAS